MRALPTWRKPANRTGRDADPRRTLKLNGAAWQRVRAEVLRRRPDVMAAERRLAASTADIGVATAELFPKLSVSAGGGFQALAVEEWFESPSARFSVLPLISWRLFDGGRVRARPRDISEFRSVQARLVEIGSTQVRCRERDAGEVGSLQPG